MVSGKKDEVLGTLADEVARRLRERQIEEQLLTVGEVAKLLGASQRSVWAWASSGKIPRPLRIGHRSVRWRRRDIQEWLQHAQPAQ